VTNSVYILGAAGTGKSTFMSELLVRLNAELGPLEDLHSKPNARGNLVTLRGHRVDTDFASGLYLGVMREQFPGSDGLDRASSPTGEEWLEFGDVPPFILAEGATLATRRFMYGLHAHTNLLMLAFRCDPVVHDLRLLSRGAGQVSSFVRSTVTKTENLVKDLQVAGATVEWVDSDDPGAWEIALNAASTHLKV
jgi:hypothetical protein